MCPVNERCPTRDLKHVFSFVLKEVLCSSSFCFTQSTHPYEKVEKTKMPKFLIWWFLTIKLKRKLARKMLGFFLQVLLPSLLLSSARLKSFTIFVNLEYMSVWKPPQHLSGLWRLQKLQTFSRGSRVFSFLKITTQVIYFSIFLLLSSIVGTFIVVVKWSINVIFNFPSGCSKWSLILMMRYEAMTSWVITFYAHFIL